MKEEKSTFWTCFTVIVGVATVIAAVFAGLTYFDIKIPLSKESSVENGIIVDKQEQTSKLEDKKTEDDIVDVDPLFVNLGLSVKWSIRNIGALLPEEFGDYYAWGETEPKTEYTWSNYKWCKGFDAPQSSMV